MLFEFGVDPFDGEQIDLYFERHEDTKEDDEIFEIFVNHSYIDNDNYDQCAPTLWTLLKRKKFDKFEYLVHAISMDITYFFKKTIKMS